MTCYNDSGKSKKYQKHQNEADNLHDITNNHSNHTTDENGKNLIEKKYKNSIRITI